ncbi:efflux RND transporter permease subunit [Hymenobacter terrenus]|uniref:efflux RND transporter permease subunit n=1 Tax=Hymenobacter terrenus TaxID=1629124 RepID=UPI0006975DA0|nr:efflux RND transporter permease subunit [Hymenobacter terrenus]
MNLTQLSISRPILIIVLFLVLGLGGLFAYTQLRYELLPDISTPFVTVTTTWPGASPQELETSVTKPMEDAVAAASRVKRITAQSLENVSVVTVEFRVGTDVDLALQDCQRRVNELTSTLPAGVKAPALSKFALTDLPVLRLAATSRLSAADLGELLKTRIRPRLAQVPGVGQLTLVGQTEREVEVNLDPEKLRALDVSVQGVVGALQAANLNVPAGALDAGSSRYAVRVLGKSDDLAGLRQVVVRVSENGRQVRLGEVATLRLGEKPIENLNRFNGQAAVGLLVSKQSSANNVEVSELVRAELKVIEAENKASGLKFLVAQDGSEFTLAAAEAVNHDLILAVGLVALVMFVFLHSLRSSLIVMVAIPASLLTTFGAMLLMDFTLNLLTLLAVSLVVGILVDDSIVVLESIYHQLEQGVEKREAALKGRMTIGFAALAVTLVDVVVFVPLSLAPGLVGDLLRQFSLVVVVSTMASLLVSFTLTPMIAARFGKLEDVQAPGVMGAFGRWIERQYERLQDGYTQLLQWSLNHRRTVYALVLALFVAAVALPALGLVGGAFMAPTDKGEVTLVMQLPEGATLAETDRAAQQVEAALRRRPEVRRVFTNVGANPDGLVGLSSTNTAEINITFVPQSERKATLTELAAAVKQDVAKFPGLTARVSPIGILGSGDGAPVQLIVSGANREEVERHAVRISDALRRIAGTADVRVSGQSRRPEVRVDLDREKVARFGLTTAEVGGTLRTALTGYDDLKVQRGEQSTTLRVRLDSTARTSPEQLGKVPVINAQGQLLELGQVARLRSDYARAVLERKDRDNAVTVFAQAVGRPVGDIGNDLRTAVDQLRIPPTVRLAYAGDLELQDDAFGPLAVVFGAAILLMYLVMVALYNSWLYPLVVLFSIPVALVGALFALAITNNSLNVFTILGLIMMLGLVAKNAILLVDRANHNRDEGQELQAALLEAGTTRLRPILMTTLAMVFGMLPIALSTAPGAELKTGLAWTLIGGLSSSMVLTLVLVPAVYFTFAKLQTTLSNWLEKRRGTPALAAGTATILVLILSSLPARAQVNPPAQSGQPTPAQAAQAEMPLSLAEALARTRSQNAAVQAARLDVQRGELRRREAAAAALPTLNATGQYTRNFKAPVFFFPTIAPDPATGGLGFSTSEFQAVEAAAKNAYSGAVNAALPLLQPELRANRRLAATELTISQERLRGTEAQQVADVKRLYLRVLLAQAQQRVARQSLAHYQELLREARARQRVGLATDADTLRAYVRAVGVRPTLSRLERSALAARADLATRLDLPPGTLPVLTDTLLLAYQPTASPALPDENAAVERALSGRPELREAELNQRLSQEQVGLARTRSLPTLALFGQYSTASQAQDFRFRDQQWPKTLYGGLQLNVPLFNPTTRLRTQQAQVAVRQAEQQRRAQATQVAAEARTAAATLRDTQEQLAAQQLSVGAAERAYQLTQSRWRKGLARWTDLTNAEEDLTQARANRLQALYDLQAAQVELELATASGL